MNLFTPSVKPAQRHPNFLSAIEPSAAGVRNVLNDWADGFEDRDGKFVFEFQTTFNSCFWELYLFSVLKQLGIRVDFSHNAPDFVCCDHNIAIEATIASHAHDDVPEWEKTIEGISHNDLEGAYTQSIIRLSNALLAKATAYTNKYEMLPHIEGLAYIIAISNFATQDFNLLGDVAMQRLLYDVDDVGKVHKANGAAVPLGLFRSDAFAHVSAILYSSLATFGKARALGNDDGRFIFQAIRIRNNIEPLRIVAEKREYRESLTDGLRLFVNPFAATPIDLEIFEEPSIRRFLANKNGELAVSCHPDGDLCMRQVFNLTPMRR